MKRIFNVLLLILLFSVEGAGQCSIPDTITLKGLQEMNLLNEQEQSSCFKLTEQFDSVKRIRYKAYSHEPLTSKFFLNQKILKISKVSNLTLKQDKWQLVVYCNDRIGLVKKLVAAYGPFLVAGEAAWGEDKEDDSEKLYAIYIWEYAGYEIKCTFPDKEFSFQRRSPEYNVIIEFSELKN